jgi:hypothetical protein
MSPSVGCMAASASFTQLTLFRYHDGPVVLTAVRRHESEGGIERSQL